MTAASRLALLVEDNEDDVILLQRTVRKAALPLTLFHVDDGQRATHYLAGTGEFSDRARHPLPTLVLLDLKLPLRHGLDILQWARARRELDPVCIVVLTSSAEPTDVERACAYGANCYLTKTVAAETLVELLAAMDAAWPSAGPGAWLLVPKAERPRSTPGPA